MVTFRSMTIDPPIMNASTLSATELEEMRALFLSPLTGATVTRTSTSFGFRGKEQQSGSIGILSDSISSIYSMGYSHHPLKSYILWVEKLFTTIGPDGRMSGKPFFISIAERTPACLQKAVEAIQGLRKALDAKFCASPGDFPSNPSTLIAIEVNFSHPNICDFPPPAFNPPDLIPFLDVLAAAFREDPSLVLGLKLPPYSDQRRVVEVVQVLERYTETHTDTLRDGTRTSPWTYLTSIDALGGCLALPDQLRPTDSDASGSSGAEAPQTNGTNTSAAAQAIRGAVGGDVVHSLALGNVAAFRRALDASSDSAIRGVRIIGVGGVTSREAATRMCSAGADVVAVATLLEHGGIDSLKDLVG
ncbi:hypothetical protein CERSUDRAFT_162190 [Gelatoporia subvermispora B]|uniref:Dihydroorotate oxidase n=1 Tax=Ceriporiopsis subvermispora (strain B) TaxID=914234 RepID=M2R1H8_CERS8|nr:hypothetical protein CERSUDRAFT_162190 [Gelatoporia subvermispora B]